MMEAKKRTSDPKDIRTKAEMADTKERKSDPKEMKTGSTDPKAKMDDPESKLTEAEKKMDDPDAKNKDAKDDQPIVTVVDSAKAVPSDKSTYSLEAVKGYSLWITGISELIGTLFLVLVGCGSTTSPTEPSTKAGIAFAFGLIVTIMVTNTAHISGGHINPAVTLGMLVTRSIPILPGCVYIVCQLVGAVAGAAILFGLIPKAVRGGMGVTLVNDSIEWYHALGIEILITFVLVFTVFSVIDPSRPFQKPTASVLIGLSVTVCHLWAIPFTGSSMNIARSFGPALITNTWNFHWVYWLGPAIGGILAGLLYKFLFSSKGFLEEGV